MPPLAVAYASVGQDEEQLRETIDDLLRVEVRYLWAVRLTGPRRVEAHEQGRALRVVRPGERLTAPGVLQNPVPVEALGDRSAAHAVALTSTAPPSSRGSSTPPPGSVARPAPRG